MVLNFQYLSLRELDAQLRCASNQRGHEIRDPYVAHDSARRGRPQQCQPAWARALVRRHREGTRAGRHPPVSVGRRARGAAAPRGDRATCKDPFRRYSMVRPEPHILARQSDRSDRGSRVQGQEGRRRVPRCAVRACPQKQTLPRVRDLAHQTPARGSPDRLVRTPRRRR